ncbi:hypothetical protein ACFOWM_12185 [Ferruginibacter yonginensis]|uniref:Chondroitin AC lyase n=1 Tax=Ferruginibacter yonginensis TaxID=1310416 RepID=A0ABV8QX66_9BACT
MNCKLSQLLCVIIGLLICSCTIAQQIPSQASVAAKRNATVVYNLANPYPDPNAGCPGYSAYCLSSYYLNQNTQTADNYILNQANATFTSDCYFWNLSLVRIYLNSTYYSRMSSAAQQSLAQKELLFLNTYANLALTTAGVWYIKDSENHNLFQKSCCYLICQKLLENPANESLILSDGNTVRAHYDAYVLYFINYFREHAKKGLDVEINSDNYVKYTLACYLNVFDLSSDLIVKRLAKNYLDLYTAENAISFLKTANDVGGGATRCYKDKDMKYGKSKNSFDCNLGWSTALGGNHPTQVIVATSNYFAPEITSAIALNTKPAFTSVQASWGINLPSNFSGAYNVGFNSSGNGGMLRFSYITDNYAHGTHCYDPTQTFIAIATQNRVMGVDFNTTDKAKIKVHGIGTAQGRETGYAEINGFGGINCSVIWRDQKASNSTGTRIFVSSGELDNNKSLQNGWWFSKTSTAYVGFRVASGTLTESVTSYGKYYTLSDMWSPVIIETANITDYSSFQAFKDAIALNVVSVLADGSIKYFSESNETFQVKPNSTIVPIKNGTAVNFNLPNTFNSPYLNGMGDSYIANVSYPGYEDLVINFEILDLDIEAESVVNPNWIIGNSSNASAGSFVIPNGNIINATAAENILNFDFNIPFDGNFSIFGLGLFTSSSSNSFLVSIDNSPYTIWSMGVSNQYAWNFLNRGNNSFTSFFTRGTHRLSIAKNSSGAILDKIRISESNVPPQNPIPTGIPSYNYESSVLLLAGGNFSPPAASLYPGRMYIIRNTSTTNNVIIDNVINHQTNTPTIFTLTPVLGCIIIISDGSSWYRI